MLIVRRRRGVASIKLLGAFGEEIPKHVLEPAAVPIGGARICGQHSSSGADGRHDFLNMYNPVVHEK